MTTHSESNKLRRWLAPGLLLLLVLVFIGTFLLDSSSFWVNMMQSSAEAGIIGGLVDWFAVVAIFRHPAGIPIPHTAVIRKSKDKFAHGTYDFLIEHFSDSSRASQYVEDRRPSKHLSEWLTQAKNAESAAHIVVTSIPALLTPKSDRRIRSFLENTIVEELKKQNISPLLGRILDQFYRRNDHQEIVDVLIDFAKKYVEKNPALLRERVSEASSWFIPGFLDRKMADTVRQSLLDKLEELGNSDHEYRREIDRWMESVIADLKQSRFHAETVKHKWQTFVTSEQTRRLLGGMWKDIKNEVLGDSGADIWKLKVKLADFLQRLGMLLSEDPKLQQEIDARLSDLAGRIAPDVVDVAAEYLRDEIKGWSGEKVADKLESAVGKELQYIRINGTVLGCFVGFLLFWMVEIVL